MDQSQLYAARAAQKQMMEDNYREQEVRINQQFATSVTGYNEDQAQYALRKQKKKEEQAKFQQSAVAFLSFAGVFNIVLICVALVGESWLYDEGTTLGIGRAVIKTSLFRTNIEISCHKSTFLEVRFCEKFFYELIEKRLGGTGSVPFERLMSASCSFTLARPACTAATQLYYVSWFLLVSLSVAIILQLFAVTFLMYYMHVAPTPVARKWASACQHLSPFVVALSLCMGYCMLPRSDALIRGWNGLVSNNVPIGALMTWDSPVTVPYGWCTFWMFGTLLSFAMTSTCWLACFTKLKAEADMELIEEAEKDKVMLETMQQCYGAAVAAQPKALQNYPYQQQGYAGYGGAQQGYPQQGYPPQQQGYPQQQAYPQQGYQQG